ncbi:MAG: trypsin-like peptidase domain-containing protein [Peptococcaceae bacterium]|nr:trypsin-like peptidase domain-containing protein [Peptococcaceae bacterium]
MNPYSERRKTGILIVAAFVVGVLVTGAAFYLLPIIPSMATTQAASQAVAGDPVNPAATGLIADIVEKASPAVVKIDTTVETRGRNYDPFFNDPFFREFFGRRFQMDTGPQIAKGMGSGFIISRDGYILTNEHVVSGATKIEVTMTGKDKPVQAKLVGSDAELDLAVIKIDGDNLPVLELGDSDKVRVGELAIAIGNPYGLDHTVTVGVISAKGRPVPIQDRQYKNLLQTDASINPGNSGGPLLNSKGQVIGINTAVNASAQGIGFAIPTSTVQPVLDTLIKQGKIARPWLGVYIQTVNKEIADYLHLNKAEGAVVTGVVEGGPANKAGITQGDVIVEINHNKVTSSGDLTALVEKMKPGEKAVVVVYRDGKQVYIDVILGEKGKVQ